MPASCQKEFSLTVTDSPCNCSRMGGNVPAITGYTDDLFRLFIVGGSFCDNCIASGLPAWDGIFRECQDFDSPEGLCGWTAGFSAVIADGMSLPFDHIMPPATGRIQALAQLLQSTLGDGHWVLQVFCGNVGNAIWLGQTPAAQPHNPDGLVITGTGIGSSNPGYTQCSVGPVSVTIESVVPPP